LGGGGEGQALLLRRHGAGNVLDRAVGFLFLMGHNVPAKKRCHPAGWL